MVMTSPLVADWIGKGLSYEVQLEPGSITPLAIPPSGRVQIPGPDYDFKGYEGVLLSFSATFNSALGGISMEAEPPALDWKERYTVNILTARGLTRPANIMYVSIPPVTAAGVFSIFNEADYPWLNWCRLYVFNSDAVNPITCTSYTYMIAMLKQQRPADCCGRIIEELRRIEQLLEGLYPMPPGPPEPITPTPTPEEEADDPISVKDLTIAGYGGGEGVDD